MRKKNVLRAHRKYPLIFFIFFLIFLMVAPFLMTQDPYTINMSRKLIPPSIDHLLGTDGLGRDMLSRLIHGGRITVGTSLVILVLALGIGVPSGLIAGYAGGWFDRLFMRITDSFLAFPDYIVAIILSGLFGPGMVNLMIAIILVKWIAYARVVRNSVISEKHKDYITMARLNGLNPLHIIVKHLMPYTLSHVVVIATLDLGKIILMIASLSYIGLGVQPSVPEWGAMLNEGRTYFHNAPYAMLAPGLAIMLVVLASNVMGDQLRDRLNVNK